MAQRSRLSVALTIAGSDSGGGAGIQADLKTFASLGVHGTSAITCLTAQNPRRVRGIEAVSPRMVRQQIESVFEELPPRAVKTGMLFSQGIIKKVTRFFDRVGRPPLVVDPVMVATSGAPLLEPSAMAAMRKLLPLARIITPNLDEAAWLLERRLPSVEAMRQAARELHQRYGCAVLVKGGHLRGVRAAVDIFYDGRLELLLEAPRIMGVSTHGTGCTYSAAIAAYLARGRALPQAVQSAKEFITQAIARSRHVGQHFVLGTALRG